MRVTDPKALALFETTAEVLQGLITAYEHFEQKSEPVWQRPLGAYCPGSSVPDGTARRGVGARPPWRYRACSWAGEP
jgi:hypothetical protein